MLESYVSLSLRRSTNFVEVPSFTEGIKDM